ncbi:hypothetical protein PLICRDRAFT_170636 [Plicaturopsis crispa FD-325 SS-3]|nr:hypothetical protein PLICRDRAFT_170636 [Plicaturopsis crispa FD-325 SS-3]
MPRIRKKTSKRGSTNQRARIKHKVAESAHKRKQVAKKNVQWKSKHTKDPGIPSTFPYKDQILAEIAAERRQAAEEKQRRKDEKRAAKGLPPAEPEDNEGREDDEGSEHVFDGVRSLQQSVLSKPKKARVAVVEDEEEDEPPVLIDRDLPNLQSVLDAADVVLEVLDARDPQSYRSKHLEQVVGDKPLMFVLNKIDLVPREALESWLARLRVEHPTVPFRSASAFLPAASEPVLEKGKGKAKERTNDGLGVDAIVSWLSTQAKASGKSDEPLTVAVVGVTNTGKSSLINTLLSKAALPIYTLAESSDGPSTTTHPLTVSLSTANPVRIIDTPGLAYARIDVADDEDAKAALTKLRARDILLRNKGRIARLKDPLPALAHIISRADTEGLMLFYNLPAFSKGDPDAFLTCVARSLKLIKKGGFPDLAGAARIVLRDWSSSKFPHYTLAPTSSAAPPPQPLDAADEAVLAALPTRKEMRKKRGLVKMGVGAMEERDVVLEGAWAGDASEGGSDDELEADEGALDEEIADSDEEGSGDEDEEMGDEDDEEEEEVEEVEEPAPILSGKRKRAAAAATPAPPPKKVAFAADPKESRQARRAASASSKKAAPAPKPPAAKVSKVANGPSSKSKGAAPKPSTTTGAEEAYDFKKFF